MHHHADGAASDLSTRHRRSLFTLVLLTGLLVGAPSVVVAGHQFPDVSDDHPFHDEVAWLADEGITAGFDDGTFRPGQAVTRQAMAAFMHRLAGEPDGPVDDPGFDDVGEDHVFFAEIAWLADEGITAGFDDGTFRPGQAVTRQAMAAFMHRLAGEPDGPFVDAEFGDVSDDHPFFEQISWLAQVEISTGFDDGTFRPSAEVTRQAMAAFMHRLDDLPQPTGQLLFGYDTLYELESGERTSFADDPAVTSARGIVWSPDGQRLAMVASSSGTPDADWELVAYGSDGSRLLSVDDGDLGPDREVSTIGQLAWAPDGERIVFGSEHAEELGRVQLHVVTVDDGQIDDVGDEGRRTITHRAWSPDGTELLYTDTDDSTVVAIGVDDHVERTLATFDEGLSGLSAEWHPSGNQFAVVTREGTLDGPESATWIAPIGDEPIEVGPPSTALGGTPLWSPTGDHLMIADARALASDEPAIVRIDAETLEQEVVVSGAGAPDVQSWLDWSPDGRYIVYDRGAGGGGPDLPDNATHLVRADGTGGLHTLSDQSERPRWRPVQTP